MTDRQDPTSEAMMPPGVGQEGGGSRDKLQRTACNKVLCRVLFGDSKIVLFIAQFIHLSLYFSNFYIGLLHLYFIPRDVNTSLVFVSLTQSLRHN